MVRLLHDALTRGGEQRPPGQAPSPQQAARISFIRDNLEHSHSFREDSGKRVTLSFLLPALTWYLIPNTLCDTIKRRLLEVFHITLPDLPSSLSAAAEAARSLQPHLTISWIRTLANGWQTSSRMQEDLRRHCPWGCDADDKVQHNLQCPRLWAWIDAAAGVPTQ